MNKITIRELLCFGAGGAFGLHGAEGNWIGLIGALLIFPWLYLKNRNQMPEHEYAIQQQTTSNHAVIVCSGIGTAENASNLLKSLEHRNSKASYRIVKREVGEWQPASRTKTGPGRSHLRGGVAVEKKPYAISLFSHDQKTLVLPLDPAVAQKIANLASHFADVVVGRDFGSVVEVRPLQIAPIIEDPEGNLRYCGRNYTLGRPITAKDPNPQAKAGTP